MTATQTITIEASELADVLIRLRRLERRISDLESRHAELDELVTDKQDDLPSIPTLDRWVGQLADAVGVDLE
jgi:hypothetical protein